MGWVSAAKSVFESFLRECQVAQTLMPSQALTKAVEVTIGLDIVCLKLSQILIYGVCELEASLELCCVVVANASTWNRRLAKPLFSAQVNKICE